MGVVFLSRNEHGYAAVKLIKHVWARDRRAMQRVRREVEAAKRVPRYCTAPVWDYDFDHDPPFIVSEYIDAPSLQAEVDTNGPLSASTLHGVAIGVAAALSEIHLASIVHGDLTPNNVLLSRNGPRVIDFGIARVPEQTAATTGQIAGTPPYMAPEHYQHGQLTAAADVFAWGSVLAFAGTGHPPFGSGTAGELGPRIVGEQPDLAGLDPTVRPLVQAAMRKNPQDRPTASWLQEELKRAARAAHADQLRTTEVNRVLDSAQTPVPAAPTIAMATPRRSSGTGGFPRVPTASLLLGIAVLVALAVWLQPASGLGRFTNWLVRGLLGYGGLAVPVLLTGWAAALLRGPRTMPLWPQGRQALRNARLQRSAAPLGRAVWSATRTIVRSPTILGWLFLSLGSLGLLHLLRGAPPLSATHAEFSQSGGSVGALMVWVATHLATQSATRAALIVLLIAAAAGIAWPLHRRWGSWQAAGVFAVCLAASTIPALYLEHTHYQYWVKLDASKRIAVVQGLAAVRARVVETTGLTEDSAPTELRPQLRQGIPADGLQDARRLASAIPSAYHQPASPPSFVDGATRLTVGTCLASAQRGASAVACSRPHAAEVYAIVGTPYHRYPGVKPLDDFASGACWPRFESYVGLPPERSALPVSQFVPTAAQWTAGDRTAACLLQPWPALQVHRSLRRSRQILADDFSIPDQWAADPDNSGRCHTGYASGEDQSLYVEKNAWHFPLKKQPGLLCVATPEQGGLDFELVTDTQLTVRSWVASTARPDDRVGFVCRSAGGRTRYQMTATRGGFYAIEKVSDGQLTTLKSGPSQAVPADDWVPLRAVCSGGQQGTPVTLALWANGKLLGEVTDVADPIVSGTVGVAIVAADPEAFASFFDDFAATAPTTS